jgi:hypothetical protein
MSSRDWILKFSLSGKLHITRKNLTFFHDHSNLLKFYRDCTPLVLSYKTSYKLFLHIFRKPQHQCQWRSQKFSSHRLFSSYIILQSRHQWAIKNQLGYNFFWNILPLRKMYRWTYMCIKIFRYWVISSILINPCAVT